MIDPNLAGRIVRIQLWIGCYPGHRVCSTEFTHLLLSEKIILMREEALARGDEPVSASLQGATKERIAEVLRALDLKTTDQVDAVFALLDDERRSWFTTLPDEVTFSEGASIAHIGCHVGILPGTACKGVWQFAQAHSDAPFFRDPSYDDMAWQYWTGVVFYQKGAYVAYGWFVTDGLATNAVVRANQAALFNMVVDPNSTWVANSTRVLAQGDITITEQSSTDIFAGSRPYARWGGFRYGSDLYVVLTNANPQLTATGVSVSVPGPGDQIVQVISRDAGAGTLSFSSGSMSIGSLGPLGYRVFKFSL